MAAGFRDGSILCALAARAIAQMPLGLVDSAFASTGLPLLHVPVQKTYNPAEVRSRLTSLVG